jgi:hypothetical protein
MFSGGVLIAAGLLCKPAQSNHLPSSSPELLFNPFFPY